MFAHERLQNIEASYTIYIQNNFTTTAKTFPGQVGFDEKRQTEWTRFILQTASRRWARQVNDDRPAYGNIVMFLAQAIMYVKPTNNILRRAIIRDAVVSLFSNKQIPVLDYASGANTNLGALHENGILDESQFPRENDLFVSQITYEFKYIELTDRS